MEKTVFENTTVYNTDTMNILSELASRIVRKQTQSIRKTAIIALGILCVIIGILCLTIFAQQVLGLCLILIGIFTAVKGIFSKQLKVWGGTPTAEDEIRKFVFLDEGIQMTRFDGSRKGCLYSDIMLHSETEQYFILMQNLQTGFLICKDGFAKECIDDFRAFLIKKTFCRQFEIVE